MNIEKLPNTITKPVDVTEQEFESSSETSAAFSSQAEQTESVAEKIENPEEVFVNPEQELQNVGSAMQINSDRVSAILQDIENEQDTGKFRLAFFT